MESTIHIFGRMERRLNKFGINVRLFWQLGKERQWDTNILSNSSYCCRSEQTEAHAYTHTPAYPMSTLTSIKAIGSQWFLSQNKVLLYFLWSWNQCSLLQEQSKEHVNYKISHNSTSETTIKTTMYILQEILYMPLHIYIYPFFSFNWKKCINFFFHQLFSITHFC